MGMGINKKYVDNKFSSVNASPKGVYATLAALQAAFPTGNANIYLVTADGKWYYWSGSAWIAGTVYQSTGLSDNSVAFAKLDSLIQPSLKQAYTAQTINLVDGSYYDSSYVSHTDSSGTTASISVTPGEVYKLTSYTYYAGCRYIILNASNAVLAFDANTGSALYTDTLITIPANATTMVLQTEKNKKYYFKLSKLTGYVTGDAAAKVSGLETNLQNCFGNLFSLQDALTYTAGTYYKTDGTTVADAMASYTTIAITAGDTYRFTGYDYFAICLYCFKDANGIVKSYAPASQTSDYHFNQGVIVTFDVSGTLYFNKLTNPVQGNKTFVEKLTGLQAANPLLGKTLYSDGDSIAQGYANISYADYIASANNMILTKASAGGATLVTGANSILARVKALSGSYDYIICNGGTNDMFGSLSLGSLSTGYGATLDEATVIGAAESLCKTLVTNFPVAKKLFILGHRLSNLSWANTTQTDTYWNAIITALDKWSIPYIDLRKTGALMAYNQTFITNYFYDSSDGTHPNLLGYKTFYVPQITAKLKTL